ncbi:hypothetical protein, conserved [Plasmodium gonderi]|uniref:Uncharacterized protein n=1 Tax=Plasmodium gonderi TaxID=77519 RepID=A0A1Y1J8P8_PLAGO|nr:hypothetical protein, conserved [Plasmodium gonderi]GAW78879.1 hypothetical protein, conserved [Plasmodium gonderi]
MNEKEQKRHAKIIESLKYTKNENIIVENLNAICQNEGKRQDNNVVLQLIDLFLEENNYCYNENFLFNYSLLKRNKELNLSSEKKNKSKFSKQYKICVKSKNIEKVNEEDCYYFSLKKKNLCTFSREFTNSKKILFQYICNSVLKGHVHINYLIDKIYVHFQIKSNKSSPSVQNYDNTKHLICNHDLINILIETIFHIFVSRRHEQAGIPDEEGIEDVEDVEDVEDGKNEQDKKKKKKFSGHSDIQKSYLMHSKEQRTKEETQEREDYSSINLLNILKKLITIDKSFVKNVFYIFLKNVEKANFTNVNKRYKYIFKIFKEIIVYCDEFEISTLYNILLNNEMVKNNKVLYTYAIILCIINLRNVYNAYNLELCIDIMCDKLPIGGDYSDEDIEEEGEDKDMYYIEEKKHKLQGSAKTTRSKLLALFLLMFTLKIYDTSYINGCVNELIQKFFHLLKRNIQFLKNKFYHIIKTMIFLLVLVFHNLNIDKNETVIYILKCIDKLLEIYYQNGMDVTGRPRPSCTLSDSIKKELMNKDVHIAYEENNLNDHEDEMNSRTYETDRELESMSDQGRNESFFDRNVSNMMANNKRDNSLNFSELTFPELNIFEFNVSPVLLCLTIPIYLEYNLNEKNENNSNGVNRKIMETSRRLKNKWVMFFTNYNNRFFNYLKRRDIILMHLLNRAGNGRNSTTSYDTCDENRRKDLNIMDELMKEVNYVTSEVKNFAKEDVLEILCINNILFYLHEIFTHIDMIYLIRFFELCEYYEHKFCCVNIVRTNQELHLLLKLNTKFCINTFENLKNENISKMNFVYINMLILSLFECNLFYVFKFMSYYCLINSSELLMFIPSLLFVYNMSHKNYKIQGESFKMESHPSYQYINQTDIHNYVFILRSLILHVLAKIGCSDNNVPIIYNCICILLNIGSCKGLEEAEDLSDDGINHVAQSDSIERISKKGDVHIRDKNCSSQILFNKLYFLHCYDKLVDTNENIISKYFKYVENTFELANGIGKDNTERAKRKEKNYNHGIEKNNRGDDKHINNDNKNIFINSMTKEDVNIFFDLKNVLILLKLCRFYNVSNYVSSIIKLINSFFRKYKNKIIHNNYFNKLQNGIIKMSILILVILSMKKYIEFEIIYDLLKKNFLKNLSSIGNSTSHMDGSNNSYNCDIICSIITFTRYYINYLIYEKEKLCAEQYDILYHTKLKYIFKDLYKLISLNDVNVLTEIVNVVSVVYPVYYRHFDMGSQVESSNRALAERGYGMPEDMSLNIMHGISSSTTMYNSNSVLCDLNMHEKKNLLNLFFDKHFVHESFLKSETHNNIYENMQKAILKDEISNLSLYNLRNENSSNNNHLVRVLYKLFNSNINNDKNSNFNYYVKLLLTDKFQHLGEIISILKNLPFFHVHYISSFFYVINCFFEKIRRKFESQEDFILHLDVKRPTRKVNENPDEKSNVTLKGEDSSSPSTVDSKKESITYEVICNRICEEIKSIINEDNLNIYVFYPVLSILCKHNNDINEILNFFYKRIDIYVKDDENKLQGNKNEIILIFLCLNYIHTNISQIPHFYPYLINMMKRMTNKNVRNILLLCLSTCCYYTNLSSIQIIEILDIHRDNLESILHYGHRDISNDVVNLALPLSVSTECNFGNVSEDIKRVPQIRDKNSDNDIGRDGDAQEEGNNDCSNDTDDDDDDNDNLHFFLSLNNLCFYLYKHYNSQTFDEMIKNMYDTMVKSLQKKVDNTIVSMSNVMMYLYIKKVIDVYEIMKTLKMILANVGSSLIYDSKYVVYAFCSFYRFLTFYYKKHFDCFMYEESEIGYEEGERSGSCEVEMNTTGDSTIRYESLKERIKSLSRSLHQIIVHNFEELEDKNVSLISYCNLIGIRNMGWECISLDYFDSNEYCNMAILFINRFVKKDFEIKKCVSLMNNILACTESDDENATHDENLMYGMKNTRTARQEWNVTAKKDENLFVYQNNNYKLNNDIIVNDHCTILTLVCLFCYKYYEEINCAQIKIENLEKKNMLYYVYSNLLLVENYMKGFLKMCKLIDIDANFFKKNKEYEQVKLIMLHDIEENEMSSLNLFNGELYNHVNIFLKTMKLINYIKLDVQIKNIVLNIYSYVAKLIKIYYIFLEVMIEKIVENISTNIKGYYEIYKEYIQKVHILYECRICIFGYFSLFSSFKNSYSHIFCNFSNYFHSFSTYEKYMFIKCITNFKKIKKEEIKFLFLNILKSVKLFHEDTSLWIFAISILKILLKRIYKNVRKMDDGKKEPRKNYYDLCSYIKFSFIAVFNETVLTVYRDNYYNHYSIYENRDKCNSQEYIFKGNGEKVWNKHKYNKWKNKTNGEDVTRSMSKQDTRGTGEGCPNSPVYVDIPFSVMLCIADFLSLLCKIVIKENLEEEINMDELLREFSILIQGYVILKLKAPVKKLNLIKNKILFYEPKYHFTFKERLQDFYCAQEKRHNGKKLISLTLDDEKFFYYFQNIFLIKECIYISYIYSHYGEKQMVLDSLLQMCNMSQVNKDYLYVIISSFILFSMKCKNSSFLLNNVMYNFGPVNELSCRLRVFLSHEGHKDQIISRDTKREEMVNENNDLNPCDDTADSASNNGSGRDSGRRGSCCAPTDGSIEEKKHQNDVNISKMLIIIEEEFIRTKMRNSFRKGMNRLWKEDNNLLKELYLKKDVFFLKKLGIYYMIKNTERKTQLKEQYDKLVSIFCKKEEQNLFIKLGNICNSVYDTNVITKCAYTQDIIDNSYMNINFFNKNAEDNAFTSGEYEIFTKYLSVPLCMKDVFTFFELNLNKNILTNSYNELFNEKTKRAKKKRDGLKESEDNQKNQDCTKNSQNGRVHDNPSTFSDLSDLSDSDDNDNDNYNNNKDTEKKYFQEKQKKKKKILLYDNTLLNYLSSKYYSLNNYELYLVNIGFVSNQVRNRLLQNRALCKGDKYDHKKKKTNNLEGYFPDQLADQFSNQFTLLQTFFKNLIFFFMTFPKGIALNNSDLFFPENKNHFVHKVINFLSHEYVSKYS